MFPVEECKGLGGRLAYPVTARQRENYLELLQAETLWVMKLRSANMTGDQWCPALVAGQSHFRTAEHTSHISHLTSHISHLTVLTFLVLMKL